jgi:hypothetical protein
MHHSSHAPPPTPLQTHTPPLLTIHYPLPTTQHPLISFTTHPLHLHCSPLTHSISPHTPYTAHHLLTSHTICKRSNARYRIPLHIHVTFSSHDRISKSFTVRNTQHGTKEFDNAVRPVEPGKVIGARLSLYFIPTHTTSKKEIVPDKARIHIPNNSYCQITIIFQDGRHSSRNHLPSSHPHIPTPPPPPHPPMPPPLTQTMSSPHISV